MVKERIGVKPDLLDTIGGNGSQNCLDPVIWLSEMGESEFRFFYKPLNGDKPMGGVWEARLRMQALET